MKEELRAIIDLLAQQHSANSDFFEKQLLALSKLECPDPVACPVDEPKDSDGVVLELPDDFRMETMQLEKSKVLHMPFEQTVGNNRWMSETFNGATYSVNAWGFGGNAGGTEELNDAYVNIYKNDDNNLVFQWWVGGYHLDFSGKPADGWWSARGGNDVKAYPRVGIGSASGQEVSTVGTPFNVPCKKTNGWKHVDQEMIQQHCGLPVVLKGLPQLDIVVDYKMQSGYTGLDNDKYGSYFMAVDSYLHDVSRGSKGITNINGINDTSGSIYNQQMSDLPDSTKEWAIMIWMAKSPYFETSGGKTMGQVLVDEKWYIVKYKIEKASDKDFKYISFTRDVDATLINDQSGTINYNAFVDVYTSPEMQAMLDSIDAKDSDGNRVMAPTKDLVLSDVNFGIELLCNPDVKGSTAMYPVSCEFKELCFKVGGFGEFGFRNK